MNVGAMCITGLETGPDDDGGWNLENGGRISVRFFSRCLAIWLLLQGRDVSVREASAAFNTTSYVVGQAASWRESLRVDGETLRFVKDRARAREAIDLSALSDVVQVISAAQNAEVTVGDVAILLIVPPDKVREAVEEHPYMYLVNDEIEHDGE